MGHLDNGQVKLKEGKHARAKDANIVHQDPNLICIFNGDVSHGNEDDGDVDQVGEYWDGYNNHELIRILMVAATMVNGEGDHDYGDDRETEEDSHLNLLLLEPAHDHR